MTYLELVKEVAAQHGRDITEREAEHILWGHTGFPSFIKPKEGQTMQDALREQIEDFFKSLG